MPQYLNKALMPPIVVDFVNDMIVTKASSKLTVNEYLSDLRLFFRFLAAEEKNLKSPELLPEDFDLSYIDSDYISNISLRDVNNFLTYCTVERNNSARTKARKASSIKGFFKYAADKMHYIDSNPVTLLEVSPSKNKLVKYLTLEESKALLNAVKEPNKARDYCILTLFLNCGLRLAELCSLDVTDVNFERETLIVTGKGNKQRVVYLNRACILALKDYLAVRPHESLEDKDKNALFVSRLNKRIGRQAVQLMVYRYLKEIGLDGQHYSVHKLRHTAATLLYEHSDADVLELKEILGHENIATTQIYTHLNDKQLRKVAKKNPLSMESEDE